MSSEYTNECEHFNNGNCDKFYDVMCCEHPECKYKQIQQLKAENEQLKKKKEENTTFYLKKYANKDSECLELQHKVNILKQTLSENEELRSDNSMLLAQADADAFVISNLNFKIQELQQCLDEIEGLCKVAKDSNTGFYALCDVVMLKIKEVKG